MGQQIGEAGEGFPVSGRAGQTFVEAGVEDQGFPGGVGDGPEIADGVALQEGLGETPDLAGEAEALPERVGNGERLAELQPVYGAFELFVENGVGVIMETLHIGAGVENHGVPRAAEIEFGRAAVIDAAGIAGRKRGLGAFAGQEHDLRP